MKPKLIHLYKTSNRRNPYKPLNLDDERPESAIVIKLTALVATSRNEVLKGGYCEVKMAAIPLTNPSTLLPLGKVLFTIVITFPLL